MADWPNHARLACGERTEPEQRQPVTRSDHCQMAGNIEQGVGGSDPIEYGCLNVLSDRGSVFLLQRV
jgi:hypothetical protein